MLESRTHVLHPLFTSRELLDPPLRGMLTLIRVILATSQALLTQGRNPDVFRAGWWTPDPGLPYLHSPVSLAWLTPVARGHVTWLFHETSTRATRVSSSPTLEFLGSLQNWCFWHEVYILTRAFNIWKKIENLLSFYFLLLLFSSKEYRIVKFNPLIFRFWLSITKFLILMIIKLL